MKHKLIVILLALSVMSSAQSPTQNSAPEQKAAPSDAKAGCACCDKMAEHASKHEGMACMRPSATGNDDKASTKEVRKCCYGKDAKEACCAGKEGTACAKGSTMACCAGEARDGKEMACCSDKDGKNHDCCGGMQCGKHDHGDHAAPGN